MNKTVQLTDNELIQSFQQGNTRAFDVLIDRHQERIFNAINFMVKDNYLAEDLIQDIFIKIINIFIRCPVTNATGPVFCD